MNITEQQLEKQGFTRDQIQEIEEGLKDGLDVNLYAKKEFLSIQMRQIRLGLLDGLPAQRYARPEYDWFQMEEIRKGMVDGVNIEVYASPKISFDRMHQIRKGLKVGIDLSPYKQLDAGVLKQLRLAVLNRVNIVPYINAGYDMEQLEAIRGALEKKLDLKPYLRKEFRGVSIQEICEGLDHGIDVSLYAKPEYCWQQMREIRLGLEHMVDVETYHNHFYSWRQMKEIRLGLEEGLDVSYYRSLMFTAREMHEKRLALKNHTFSFRSEKEIAPVADEISKNFRIRVSPDEMEAVLEVFGDATKITRTEILKELRRREICYGVCYEEIDHIIEEGRINKPVLIARGLPEKNGEDGWYEFFFRTEVARTPKLLEHGNVDYRTVEWFETVEKGQKLACYHSATSGEKGITITGRAIPARKGKEQSILTGKGFRRLPDGRTYISETRGIVTLHEQNLDVSSLLVMDEVNLTTGNVDFQGCVLINGNVSSGASIRATEDVIVKGFVESAQITCGGNAVLRQGMNASGNGFIHAGKDVMGCFFEAVDIDAGGSIRGDYFMNCKMHAAEKLFVTGKKGTLVGGYVFAEEGLRTSNLGNQAGLSTYVKLGIGERLEKKEEELGNAIRKVNQELYVLGNAHREFQCKYRAEVRNTMEIYLKIESAVYTKEKEMETLLQKKNKLEEEKKKKEFVSAVIDNQLYEGVTVEIDKIRWNSGKVKGVTLKKVNKRIAVFANQ